MITDRLGPIIRDAVDKLASTAAASGYFDTVQTYEPKSNPGPGLVCAIWIDEIQPIALASGLAATACRVPMTCRIQLPMLHDPQDEIDTKIAVAASYMLAQLNGAFTIANAWIDILGAHGEGLGTQMGYVELDEAHHRIGDTFIDFICPDVFDQEV